MDLAGSGISLFLEQTFPLFHLGPCLPQTRQPRCLNQRRIPIQPLIQLSLTDFPKDLKRATLHYAEL
jgi:hypothetical protein